MQYVPSESSMVDTALHPADSSDPLGHLLVPPAGAWRKLVYYKNRYGWAHALLSYAGRRSPRLWHFIGSHITKRFLDAWLKGPAPRVINLGSGGLLSAWWLAADITARSDVFMDITKRLPIADGAVDVVYSEEVIEHIDQDAGQRMLAECHRILRIGGILRLTTPSLDYFAARALSSPAHVPETNAIFYSHGHRYLYSEAAMRDLLSHIGFRAVTRSRYRDPNSRFGRFDSHPARFAFAPAAWSQYWEAVK